MDHDLPRVSPLHRAPVRARRISAQVTLGAVALGSGAALLVHLLAGISLVVAVVAADALIAATLGFVAVRLPSAARLRLLRQFAIGAGAGLVATGAYDVARLGVVSLTAPTIWPFEAIGLFGQLMTSPGTDPRVATAVGVAYHLLNGTLFGAAFAVLVARPTVLKGIAWAAVLEALMVAVYPGWLSIKAMNEFLAISAAGHLAYGSVLGFLAGRFAVGGGEPRASG